MVAIDTNVLVRFLTGDDAARLRASQRVFSSERAFIADSVLLESEWVLRAAYQLTRVEICAGFRALLGLANVELRDPRETAEVIAWHESGLDFADAMHAVQSRRANALKTFDKVFVKRGKALGIDVQLP